MLDDVDVDGDCCLEWFYFVCLGFDCLFGVFDAASHQIVHQSVVQQESMDCRLLHLPLQSAAAAADVFALVAGVVVQEVGVHVHSHHKIHPLTGRLPFDDAKAMITPPLN